MKRLYTVFAILSGVFCATNAFAQAVSVTWPLDNTTQIGSSSSAPLLATGSPEIVSAGIGPEPPMTVFDYWPLHAPEGQRLWAGFTGWIAGNEDSTRYIQFDAAPTSGNQLTVSNVSFNYGGADFSGRLQANVYYSVDSWTTRTLLSGPLAYSTYATLNMAVSAPPVASGATFSLRIYPYAILNQIAGSPAFAVHNNVVIAGLSGPPMYPVYRFFNMNAGGHFYTINEAEKDTVIQNYNWFRYEGTGFDASPVQVPGTVPVFQFLPVYRFFNENAGGHFFTINEEEKDTVIQNYKWFRYEGIGFYASTVAQPGTLPLYRFFNSIAGGHFYTINEAEKNTVIQNYNWFRYEGIGFYAYPPQ